MQTLTCTLAHNASPYTLDAGRAACHALGDEKMSAGRCRVVGVSPVERSYHIFYMLCQGGSDDLRKKLKCGHLSCLPL